jgi:hypothetical protein
MRVSHRLLRQKLRTRPVERVSGALTPTYDGPGAPARGGITHETTAVAAASYGGRVQRLLSAYLPGSTVTAFAPPRLGLSRLYWRRRLMWTAPAPLRALEPVPARVRPAGQPGSDTRGGCGVNVFRVRPAHGNSVRDGRRAAATPGRALLGRFPLPRKGHGTPPKRSSDAQNRPSDSPSMVPARGSRVNRTVQPLSGPLAPPISSNPLGAG